MYQSLECMLVTPVTIKPLLKRDGTGAKVYGKSIVDTCYPTSKLENVTTNEGNQVTSTTQLYLRGTSKVEITDTIIFNGMEYSIASLAVLFENCIPDIKVVYL